MKIVQKKKKKKKKKKKRKKKKKKKKKKVSTKTNNFEICFDISDLIIIAMIFDHKRQCIYLHNLNQIGKSITALKS